MPHVDTAGLQAEIDAGPAVDIVEQAQGKGRIETYTVMHDRADHPVQGIVLGRLDDGWCFVANTPAETDLLDAMTNEEFLNRTGGGQMELVELMETRAEARAELEAARLMMIQAAATFDEDGNAGAHANMAKLLGSRAAVKAVEAALQTHGGYGFDRDYDIITLWPSARLMEIALINNEMLLN